MPGLQVRGEFTKEDMDTIILAETVLRGLDINNVVSISSCFGLGLVVIGYFEVNSEVLEEEYDL